LGGGNKAAISRKILNPGEKGNGGFRLQGKRMSPEDRRNMEGVEPLCSVRLSISSRLQMG